ncbi:SRPBCC family protein [Stenotrophobium rhamnosiphilum]|uniref:Polyketide cyclase n=1 Tax=Stenotrophobium rhamnosiphilum TaxID=2029166 RepID=A0A2T5MFY9_9GAMM|nr:SRPBCC family protein [Stenotrophobium rhamnosiphilum]PTU31485.1 polyketide cyclase [Stenotrophobium rhamnosiphilum]
MRKLLIIVLVAIAAVLGYAATKPDTFQVSRSVSIKAPPEKIFPLINNLHSWTTWSPYEKLDPAMKRSYSGPESGVGAAYSWEGNNTVGAGKMEVSESTPSSAVKFKLDFFKPFNTHNTAEFTLAAEGDSTTVTWTMDGPSPYISKVMGVFFNMDKMIGDAFTDGLNNLKGLSEQ